MCSSIRSNVAELVASFNVIVGRSDCALHSASWHDPTADLHDMHPYHLFLQLSCMMIIELPLDKLCNSNHNLSKPECSSCIDILLLVISSSYQWGILKPD
uniref:Uncharacterized protein n=1 Tax=Leptocylindrus danicus TaxID=163516 RepID=A0A6U2PSW2_9STRA